MEVKLETFLR